MSILIEQWSLACLYMGGPVGVMMTAIAVIAVSIGCWVMLDAA